MGCRSFGLGSQCSAIRIILRHVSLCRWLRCRRRAASGRNRWHWQGTANRPLLFEVRIEGRFAERAPAPRGHRGESAILHQFIRRSVYSKSLKFPKEKVRPQFLSLRQDAQSGHSFSPRSSGPKARRMRPFLGNCPNHGARPEGPLWACFRLSRPTFSDATEPEPFWYGS
jgi:hypothetical protein